MKTGDKLRVTQLGIDSGTDMDQVCVAGDTVLVKSYESVYNHYNATVVGKGINLILFTDDVENGYLEEL